MTHYVRKGQNIDRGLVGYWKLDDFKGNASQTVAIDQAKFNDGLFDGMTNTTGINGVGNAILDNGNGDVVYNIENSAGEVWNNTNFTVANWVKVDGPNDAVTVQAIFIHAATSVGNRIYLRVLSSAAEFTYSVGGTSLNTGEVTGQWQHVALVHNKANGLTKFYVDGIQTDSRTILVTDTETVDMFFGNQSQSNNEALEGSMANMRVYNRTLNQAEVNKLYRTRQ